MDLGAARGLGNRAPLTVGRSLWGGVRWILLEKLVAHRRGAARALPRAVGLSHIHLQVSDLAAAEGFYAGTLGMGVKERTVLGDGRPLRLFPRPRRAAHRVPHPLSAWAIPRCPTPPATF